MGKKNGNDNPTRRDRCYPGAETLSIGKVSISPSAHPKGGIPSNLFFCILLKMPPW